MIRVKGLTILVVAALTVLTLFTGVGVSGQASAAAKSIKPGPCESKGVLYPLTSISFEDANALQVETQLQDQAAPGCASTSAISALLKSAESSTPAKWSGPTTHVVPPKHVTLGLVSCDAAFAGCTQPLTGVEQAAKVLGWSYKFFNGNGDPTTETADILQAVSLHVNAIIEVDMSPPTIQQGLAGAKKANIPVFSTSSGTESPNPTVSWPGEIVPVDVGSNYVQNGRWQADYIIQDSGGKANVLLLNNPALTSDVSTIAAADEFNKRCPSCKVSVLNFSDSEVDTTLASTVVGYLKSNPSVAYLVVPADPFAQVIIPALDQAGLTKVKLCGLIGLSENLSYIQKGNVQACDAVQDNVAVGWAAVDQVIRQLDKKPLAKPYGENLPQELITSANRPANNNWVIPFNYKADYEKLWGLN